MSLHKRWFCRPPTMAGFPGVNSDHQKFIFTPMRLSLLGTLTLVVAATAASIETNAERLARGLPPLPPANVARAVDTRTNPSPQMVNPRVPLMTGHPEQRFHALALAGRLSPFATPFFLVFPLFVTNSLLLPYPHFQKVNILRGCHPEIRCQLDSASSID
ncbi:hypothetical protein EDD15DRAFT_603193 [Pisolithus albus]|nr:hypothetical protein EDD15DRAFT_603193 [Pisolithus albus]